MNNSSAVSRTVAPCLSSLLVLVPYVARSSQLQSEGLYDMLSVWRRWDSNPSSNQILQSDCTIYRLSPPFASAHLHRLAEALITNNLSMWIDSGSNATAVACRVQSRLRRVKDSNLRSLSACCVSSAVLSTTQPTLHARLSEPSLIWYQ